MAMLAVIAYIYAVKNGQFEDLESPKWKILFDQNISSENLNQSHSVKKEMKKE